MRGNELFFLQTTFVYRSCLLFRFKFLPVYFVAGIFFAEIMAFKLLKYAP